MHFGVLLNRMVVMKNALPTSSHPLACEFREFVRDTAFPCVGAKAALGRDQMKIVLANSIASGWNDLMLYSQILQFVREYQSDPALFQTLIFLFEGPRTLSEQAFEDFLWQRLQSFADKDVWLAYPHDNSVSSDPASQHFSMSFGGQAFFVVGLHPHASRTARRFRVPAMVLNVHQQFEQLREQGRYEKLRSTILERDKALQGDLNPMLARHGETSEARQYSGRNVDASWACPFQRGDTASSHDNA